MDEMVTEALDFIRANSENPFFLYLPFPVPHVSIQVPEDSLGEYDGSFPEEPYLGDKSYLPHPAPRAGYAAMITRMDREIGRIMALLEELGLKRNTLVIFTSDNGPTFNGGSDSAFFESTGPLRGLKTTLYEGGIRIPMIAHWPGMIEPGSVSDHISAFWDFLPTFTDLAGVEPPTDIDGVSLLPTLLGQTRRQIEHEYLYWELSGKQAVRLGNWKAVRMNVDDEVELYNLKEDTAEQRDIAAENPDVVARIEDIMVNGRTESDLFPIVRRR